MRWNYYGRGACFSLGEWKTDQCPYSDFAVFVAESATSSARQLAGPRLLPRLPFWPTHGCFCQLVSCVKKYLVLVFCLFVYVFLLLSPTRICVTQQLSWLCASDMGRWEVYVECQQKASCAVSVLQWCWSVERGVCFRTSVFVVWQQRRIHD